jgi:TPR repeat protein
MNQYRFLVGIFLICSISLAIAQQTAAERKILSELQSRADKGEADAQLQLGMRYAKGDGVTKDLSKAFKWHRKAAEQGLARAQLVLGMDYAAGAGVKADQTEAFNWVQRAAKQELAEAELELGRFYSAGNGVKEWPVEAAKWYRKAAEQGLAGAEFALGNCYFEGSGVTKNVAEGLNWIREAAEQGYAAAQNKLGHCYMKGEGVAKDNLQAYIWLNLAAAQADESEYTKLDLAKVEQALTPEQVTEAQRLSREFKPSQPSPGRSSAATPGSAAQASESSIAGLVNVTSEDQTCEIYVDGAFVGNAPAKLKLSEGNHVIEVKKTGFDDFRREVRVTAGSVLTLRVALEKK